MGNPDSVETAAAGTAVSADHGRRLADLRAELARREVQGFLIPRGDEHQGEYVPDSAQRLAWLTGFNGSAGTAAVLPEAAAIFVDGRYTLQVRNEVDGALFAPRHITEEPLSDWLREHLKPGQRLAYDPWLHTRDQVERVVEIALRHNADRRLLLAWLPPGMDARLPNMGTPLDQLRSDAL